MSDQRPGNGNDNGNGNGANTLPQTVDEAVDQLIAMTSPADLAQLRQMSQHDLILLHFSLGIAIRNQFGLWGKNPALLTSCANVKAAGGSSPLFVHPDDASEVIIEALWRRLQEQEQERQ